MSMDRMTWQAVAERLGAQLRIANGRVALIFLLRPNNTFGNSYAWTQSEATDPGAFMQQILASRRWPMVQELLAEFPRAPVIVSPPPPPPPPPPVALPVILAPPDSAPVGSDPGETGSDLNRDPTMVLGSAKTWKEVADILGAQLRWSNGRVTVIVPLPPNQLFGRSYAWTESADIDPGVFLQKIQNSAQWPMVQELIAQVPPADIPLGAPDLGLVQPSLPVSPRVEQFFEGVPREVWLVGAVLLVFFVLK